MKRLIVCCDGTWNNPEQEHNGIPAPTNVYKLHNAVADKDPGGRLQLKYYHPGVGGEGGVAKSITGGAVGAGISRNICSAYHWLGSHYAPGDEIYLYGFSRGAFTVRSLCGFLHGGLLDLRGLPSREAWGRVDRAYKKGYRGKGKDWAKAGWKFFHKKKAPPVHFVGVWDTVGALGVPDDLEFLNLFDIPKKWRFHDTNLKPNVKTARHAMAMDEQRSSFSVTRWANAENLPGVDLKEVWFPGVHADVGGGYAECDLSDGALLWMMEQSEAVGLAFRTGVGATLRPDPLGIMHNSYKGAFAKLRSRPRNLDAVTAANGARFHPGVFERQRVSPIAYPPYHPTRTLAKGDTCTVEIYADTRWNPTGVYLEAGGAYTFSAEGEWQDSKDTCDWRGTEDGKLTMGDVMRGASSFLGKLEGVFKDLSGNRSTDFLGTKRIEGMNWFVLVGAIANDRGRSKVVKNDGSPHPHQYVALPEHEKTPLRIDHPGYLYCFPNDVWSLYGNNHGSIRLTIRRVA